MRRKLYICILCALLGCVPGVHAQDIHFSQFFETPLLRNPALAGIFSGDVRVQAVYRSQWNSVTNAYKTGSFNGEIKMPIGKRNDFVTIGVAVLYDKAGTIDLTATHILPVLNYHKSLNSERNMYLSLGFTGGWVQRRIDRSKVTTNSQYDGTGFNPGLSDGETDLRNSYSYLDAGVGMSFNTQLGENSDDNLYVALSYQHLNKSSKVSFYGNPNYEMIPKWVGSAGLRMNMNESAFFTIQADYSSQGPYRETVFGTLFSKKLDDPADPTLVIHAGGFLRWGDAFIPVIKLEKKPVSIALSYDINISQLKTASTGRGGFELSLTYQRYRNSEDSYADDVRCPKF